MKIEMSDLGFRVFDDKGQERCRCAGMEAAAVQIAMLIKEIDSETSMYQAAVNLCEEHERDLRQMASWALAERENESRFYFHDDSAIGKIVSRYTSGRKALHENESRRTAD